MLQSQLVALWFAIIRKHREQREMSTMNSYSFLLYKDLDHNVKIFKMRGWLFLKYNWVQVKMDFKL